MSISQKCQYALRAVLELAKHHGGEPTRIADIADAQAIPPKFLALILAELKRHGVVESRRGTNGGYLLTLSPHELAVGDIIAFMEGPVAPVRCIAGEGGTDCPLRGRCGFLALWQRARDAVARVYDTTTFRDLIEQEAEACRQYVPSYCI